MRQRLKREIAREKNPEPVATMTDDEVTIAFELEIARMIDGIAEMKRPRPERRVKVTAE